MIRPIIVLALIALVIPTLGHAAGNYGDANWKLVDVMDAARIQALTAGQARSRCMGLTQEFANGTARGPFLTCPNGGRVTTTRYLSSADATADEHLRDDWLNWGVTSGQPECADERTYCWPG